jgi:hypothetical protein
MGSVTGQADEILQFVAENDDTPTESSGRDLAPTDGLVRGGARDAEEGSCLLDRERRTVWFVEVRHVRIVPLTPHTTTHTSAITRADSRGVSTHTSPETRTGACNGVSVRVGCRRPDSVGGASAAGVAFGSTASGPVGDRCVDGRSRCSRHAAVVAPPVELTPDRLEVGSELIVLGGQPVGTTSLLGERSLCSFRSLGLLPQLGTGSSEFAAELMDLLPGCRCLVAPVIRDVESGWFVVASLSGAEGADAIGVGRPLSGPATLAGNCHEADCNGTQRFVHPTG